MKPKGPEIKPDAAHSVPLLPSAVALVAGIAFGRFFQSFPYATAALSVCMLAALLAYRRLSPGQRAAAAVFFLLGIASFFVYGPGAPSSLSGLIDKGPVRLTGEVVRPPEEREGYTIVYLEPEVQGGGVFAGRAGLVRMTVQGTGHGIAYGDVISGVYKLSSPVGFRNPGTFEWGEYARLNGVDATAYARPGDIERGGNRAGFVLGRVYALRQELTALAKASLPQEGSALFRAMILGDEGGVTQDMRDKFAASGTTHILSVSGSHLALFSALIFFMVRWSFFLIPRPYDLRLSLVLDYRKVAAAATITASTMYCLLAGSETATVRSLIMIAAFMSSILIERETDILNTLSAAAIIALVWSPAALFDISFQLSYGAVFFMALLAKGVTDSDTGQRRAGLYGKARRYVLATAVVSGVVILGTAPIVARNFNSFSYVALPANFVVVPLAGAVCVPVGLLSCLIYALSHASSLPLSGLNALLYGAFYFLVRLFASAPSANLHPSAPGVAITVLFYISMTIALIWRRWRLKMAAAAMTCAAVFCVSVFVPHGPKDVMEVVFLDVGQGDCSLARFPDGRNMLIDGGGSTKGIDPGRSAVAPYLWNHGIRRLDYVVLTHPHTDNLCGLIYIMENFDVGQVWEGGLVDDGEAYRRFCDTALMKGIPRYALNKKGEVGIGAATVQVMHTGYDTLDDAGMPQYNQYNNRSLVLRVKYKDVSFLFTGDVEHEAEAAMLLSVPPLPLKSTVMKVPHHGSAHSCDEAFLSAVSPALAVIEVGRYNRYGFPAREAVDALHGVGARVCRTDLDGAVSVITDGKGIRVNTYEESVLKPASTWAEESENWGKLWRL